MADIRAGTRDLVGVLAAITAGGASRRLSPGPIPSQHGAPARRDSMPTDISSVAGGSGIKR
jgi:hypothetical protein